MKKMKWFLMFGVIFVLIFSLAACNGSTTPSNTSDEGDKGKDDEKTEEVGTVNIGYTGPLSGPAAFYGERTLNGVKMAAEEEMKQAVLKKWKKYKLNVVSLDDKYLPNEAGANAKRLVQEQDD